MNQLLTKLNHHYLPQHIFHGPKWLALGVNNVCNLHCKMCDVGTGNTTSVFAQNLIGTRPLNMPIELFKKIVDDTARYFPQTKIGYASTEPLVYPHLEESLHYAHQKGLYTAITTNALTLAQKAEVLCENGLNKLFISLDGLADTHNYIRGHKQSFQKAIAGIEKVLSYEKRPEVSVYCTINEWNFEQLTEFASFFSKYPLGELGFMHLNYTTEEQATKHNAAYGDMYFATASNMDEINIDAIKLDVLLQQAQQLKAMKLPFKVSMYPWLLTGEQLNEYYHQPSIKVGKRCNDAFTNVMIKSNGDVIPAHGRCFNLRMGNLNEQNLKEIWNSPAAQQFRKTLNKAGGLLPACNRCCSALG